MLLNFKVIQSGKSDHSGKDMDSNQWGASKYILQYEYILKSGK